MSGRGEGWTAVFDLDGTLVDSALDLHAVLVEALHADGLPVVSIDQTRRMIGGGIAALLDRAWDVTGSPKQTPAGRERRVQEFVARYADTCAHRTQAFPGVPEMITTLRSSGWKLAICTNKPTLLAEKICTSLGMRTWFDGFVGGGDLPVRKPDGAPLAEAIRRAGGDRSMTIMVGDGEADVGAARALGIPVVLVSFGYRRQPLSAMGADAVIDAFGELPAVLHRLQQR